MASPARASKSRSKATKKTADPGMSDEAVKAKTGKTWEQWVAALDGLQCHKLAHSEIAVLVERKFGVRDWWSQMVTVGYERLRGLREKHETERGYQVSASKTIEAPAAAAFSAWTDVKIRESWLGKAPLVIRKATPHKSVRVTWEGPTTVEINIYVKGKEKCQVTAQHNKLGTAAAGARQKQFWKGKLEKLKALLEKTRVEK
jgi:hypothetical protein